MKYGIGIDISKGKSTVAIMTTEGEVIEEPFEIMHDKKGLGQLEDKVKNIPKDDIKIVMEETGTYHLPVMEYLKSKGYFVVAENALKIKKYLDRGLRKAKTDKKDAYKLAEYCCDNWRKLEMKTEESETYQELKYLSRQYIEHISIKSELKVNFSNICDLLFPGYYQLLDDNNFELGLEIFRKYYSPELVNKKSQKQFYNEIEKMSKKIGHKSAGITLAKKIYSLAQDTISLSPISKYKQHSVNDCIDVLILEIKTTDSIIADMEEIGKTLPEYEVVNEMPGCGKKLTVRIIAEIGDIRRFNNAGSIIAYAGLDAPPYSSGQYNATIRHISKRGNKYLRKTGYEIIKAIKCNKNCENEILDFVIKKENEGKPKKVAKIAGLNKFLRVYYGKVKAKYIELGIW